MTLISIFDQMAKNEKILQDQNQDLHMLIKMTNLTLESSKRKNNSLNGKLKEAEKRIFHLEQLVRLVLKICVLLLFFFVKILEIVFMLV